MQLVIDIDKEMYEDCKTRNTLHYSLYDFSNIIANGVILPKGHGRLIDADAVLEEPIGNTYKDIDIAETIVAADKGE